MMKYSLGDRVIVVRIDHYTDKEIISKIGIIVKDLENYTTVSWPYYVEFTEELSRQCSEGQITLATESALILFGVQG